jgi:tRNA threonylcarbamoyl adenosine modification protein (Sua5/YciO/YrdC/YwlC family)
MNVEEATKALKAGLLVGVPTDTVYGIAADPWSETGMRALYELKGRDPERPIALLVADLEQARRVCTVGGAARDLALRHWPGPLTLVTEAAVGLPAWVGDPKRGTVGVRVPDHPVARRLLTAVGAIAASSANRSGEAPAVNANEAARIFGEAVAGYLPGESRSGLSSTVVDVTVDPPLELRRGPIVVD